MYGLAPEKLLRLVYEPFYLAISLTFYDFIKSSPLSIITAWSLQSRFGGTQHPIEVSFPFSWGRGKSIPKPLPKTQSL
jgi:hypothetical protein